MIALLGLPRGSSPHTRGAPRTCGSVRFRRRDHPRIRGEHCHIVAHGLVHVRIIPAYAGSTMSIARCVGTFRGSSPHTRGALGVSDVRYECTGIIPAYAGSTISATSPSIATRGSSPHTRGARIREEVQGQLSKDHPRIRGEHQRDRHLDGERDRIIPAYAGSTVRGLPLTECSMGSSPHTRGAHLATCVTIPHSSVLDSVVKEQSRISTQPRPRCYPPNLLAARYLLALLHPFCGIPSIVASSVPSGLFINSTPSQSIGCQSG